jgi:hypothetical protein
MDASDMGIKIVHDQKALKNKLIAFMETNILK